MHIDKEHFFHLTYCSNVHAGETWAEVFLNLKEYIPTLKEHFSPHRPFGIGLRLSNKAADELLANNEITYFKKWLSDNDLYVFTINGFPYGGFHRQRVKEQVYAPDWNTTERRDYCLKLVKILAALTPSGEESGFSTTPLSYKPWLDKKQTAEVYYQASLFLSEIVAEMVTIYNHSNKFIHIDIEPEPDCLIETIDELVLFFKHWLIPVATPHLATLLNVTPEKAKQYLHEHVRACYDICHSSVEFEQPNSVFRRLADAHILIGKVQVSTALRSKLPNDLRLRKNVVSNLRKFIDPIYLHQVIAHTENGKLYHFSDLDIALQNIDRVHMHFDELRTHFHVPIFLKNYMALESTQNDVITTLKLLQKNKATHHLEIETYTWDILPDELKVNLISSLKREYEWVINQF